MSYGLKYIMQWASQNANANDYRIELYQKDYSGEVTEKKLGFAPSLVMDNAGNGIMGTSLRFSIQADTDGELNDLYTTDSKMYKVLLYRNEAVVWNGYMLQELYSEEYIAPPYDVDVTATDQLALLKDEIYNPLGRVSLLRIIDNALSATQLDLGYAIQSSLKPEVQDSGTFLDYITVDDRGFADKTAYEVLEGVLLTLNMTICQQYNRWYLIRRNDVNAPIYIYGSDLGYLGQEEPVAAQIGQMYVNRIYPIGNLMLTKQAAKKGAKFNFTPILPLSMLNDPNTVGKEKWSYNADYIRSYPAVEVSYRGGYIKAKVDAFTLKSTKLMVKDYALWQMLEVEASEQALKLEVAYLGLVTAANNAFLPDPSVTVRLSVQIKVESDDQTYYLTQQGWSEEDAEDIVFTGNWLRNSIAAMANKDNYNTASIEFPGFPISGKFTISFRNDSTITAGHRPEENRVDLAVSNVYVTMPEIQGYNSNVLVNPNAAQMGPEQMLLFSDAYQVANESALNYNYILYPSGDVVSRWELAGRDYESFYQAMIQDISNSIGNVVNKFSGVIAGEGLLSPVYLEKFSSSVMRLEKGTYDLVQEELSGEWIEVQSNAVEVGEYDVLTNDGQRVSVGSATDSKVPTGNFASAAAFEQLTKIVNILNTIIGLDDDDNAYVKPKSDGTPRNFYTYGTMSFGGIDDGESGEGGGTGITSLYDIPEISVSAATLADGQSLVYDATLHKWVNRLVQSGSGVDMDYVWEALAGATDEKINASHIPDLSDVYLPLTGGTITGSITTLRTPGIIINREVGVPYIRFQNDADNINGELGVTTAGELVYYPTIESIGGYGKWNRVLHAGNIAQYMPDLSDIYLPLTGGYMHGSIAFDTGAGIMASNSSSNLQIGMYQNNGIFLQGPRLLYSPASGSDYKIWHEGNDGSGSGLDADLLDGLDEISFMRHSAAINLEETYLRHIGYGYENAGWAVNAGPAMAFGTSNGYTMLMQQQAKAHTLYVSYKTPDGTIRDWKTIAFIDSNITGNAASATKLQTARNIWGNLFNGTADITGNLNLNNGRSVRSWTADGSTDYDLLYLSTGNNFQIGYGTAIVGKFKTNLHGYGIDFRSKGTDGATMSLTTAGNVGIGTTTPAYKLEVNGTTHLNGKVTLTKDVVLNNYTAIKFKDSNGAELNTIMVGADNALTIGADHSVKNYETRIKGVGVTLFHGGTQVLSLTSISNISAKNILPFTNNTYNLGTRDIRWGVLYAYYGSFTNGVNNRHYYTLDGTIRAFDSNNSYLEIGGGYVSNDLPVYINGRPLMFRASDTTDLTIGADGIAIFSKMSCHDAGIKIGEATLVWDAENQCLVVDKDFVSNGTMSFGGFDLGIGNGSTIGEGLTIDTSDLEEYVTPLILKANDIYAPLLLENGKGAYYLVPKDNGNFIGLALSTDSSASVASTTSNLVVRQLWAISSHSTNLPAICIGTDYKTKATFSYVKGTTNTAASVTLDVALTHPSDITRKQILEDVCLSTEVIANAPLFKFTWKNSTDKAVHIGTSAQYWLDYAPELTALYDGKYTLDYATLGVLMGKSNASEIEQLKKRVEALEAKN